MFIGWSVSTSSISESIWILPLFVISESILTNIPNEFCTFSSLIIPADSFIALFLSNFTFVVTLVSSISAIAAELSAFAFIFFLKFIFPSLINVTSLVVVAANFIP